MKESKESKVERDEKISRRGFIGAAAAIALSAAAARGQQSQPAPAKKGFKLRYAPSLGQFSAHAGKDPMDQLQFIADEGFRGVFDNNFMGKSPEQQEAIAKKAESLGLLIGPFIACKGFDKPTFAINDSKDSSIRDMLVADIKKAGEVRKRTGAKWGLVVPGTYDMKLQWDYQTANVIENLKYCADACAASGLIMVIEPLNNLVDHPGLFLTRIPQAYQICRAVNSPYCKINNDLYHQQITEGNLIRNIDAAWTEIAAFHIGDNPGRKEPGTGEINYKNVFKHIHSKGYDGVLCMEHRASLGKGKEAERAVINAYRACDEF